MPSDWADAKKEGKAKMAKREAAEEDRKRPGKERAMARRSKPGGVTPAEHKAFRDTAVGKAMGRVFRPKKAREADAEAGPGFAAPEDVHPVWDTGATGAVEEAVAAAPEKPPGMIFYDDTATDGTIRYQPKGDPFQYRLLPDGTFQVTDPKTGAVKASAAKGSDTYQAFQDHYDAAMGVGDWKWKASGDAPADTAAPAAPDAAAGVVPLGDMPKSDEGPIPIGEMSPSEGPVNLPRVTPEVEGTPFDVAEPLDQPYTTDLGFDPEDPEDAAPPRPRVERGGSMDLGSYKEQEGRAEQARMLKGNREAFHGQMRELFGREAPEKPPYMEGGELTKEAVTTGPYRLVSPDGTVINKRVAAQIARGELDPAAWASFSEGLKGSGRIKWDMGPSVEDLLADEGFVRSVGGTPTRVAARRALDAAQQ